MRDVIHVTESDTALKFSSQYIAEDLGFFDDVGLAVSCDVDAGPGGSWLVDNLISGRAQVAMGGIWLPMLYTQVGLGCFVPVAAACHRSPSVVLSRTVVEGPFGWETLYGKRVLMTMAATSQWMFLEGVLRRHGIDPHRIRFIRDLDARTIEALWRAGYGDFYVMMDPLRAEGLMREGSALAFTMADMAGDVPWSIFYTTDAMVRAPSELIARYKSAIQRATDWLLSSPLPDVSRQLSRRFPGVAREQIETVVDRFVASGVWKRTCEIDPVATAAYRQIMVGYGLLDRPEEVPAPLTHQHPLQAAC